jgi:hypothetical protein
MKRRWRKDVCAKKPRKEEDSEYEQNGPHGDAFFRQNLDMPAELGRFTSTGKAGTQVASGSC